ncbi:MAG TPA: xylulokinase [Anaeromyxobacteraceae bacterium]|nr:xylulokinase [Anaeromyxobacteraceae bacterium]
MFLGIDVGTSEVKAVLAGEDGAVVGTAGAPLAVSRPHPRWSEQAPEAWWEATLQAIDRLREAHAAGVAAVRGVGLSGQMHGATLLDGADRPLRPVILWNDVRSGEECRELVSREPRTLDITGNLAMPGFTAPKLLWVAKHEPDVFAQVRSVLLPKDYVRLRLTGEKVSDPSDAAGTLWLDVARRDWSDAMLAATRLSRSHMPRLVEGSAPGGTLRPEIAERWGMGRGVVVAGGGGDNAASAVGIGAVAPGGGFVSLGTSGVTFVVNDRFRPNPARAVHAFCHALPGRWHQMSVMLSAASCLRWVTRLVGAADEPAALAEEAGLDAAARSSAPIFLPYLSGERSPHDDPAALGVFFGLNHDTDRGALVYAVLEGVAFGLRDGVDALRAAGTELRALSLVGGGARSERWAQLLADALGVELRTHQGGETGAALGAARLGQLAAGTAEAEVCRQPPLRRAFAPTREGSAALEERLARFRRLYGAVSPEWKRGAATA